MVGRLDRYGFSGVGRTLVQRMDKHKLNVVDKHMLGEIRAG